jgi:hypothetical protein
LQASQWSRPKKGTPTGGVASPLLANLYLHWFDALFYGPQGPGQRADVKPETIHNSLPTARPADKQIIVFSSDTPKNRKAYMHLEIFCCREEILATPTIC